MPDRRSVRLRPHTYAGGLYLVTVCAAGRRRLFGHVDGGAVRLSAVERIAPGEWVRTRAMRRGTVRLGAFVVMPDHVHVSFGIVPAAAPGTTATVRLVVGRLRSRRQATWPQRFGDTRLR